MGCMCRIHRCTRCGFSRLPVAMRGHSGSTPSIARLARNACGVAARFRRELACVHGTLLVGDMLAPVRLARGNLVRFAGASRFGLRRMPRGRRDMTAHANRRMPYRLVRRPEGPADVQAQQAEHGDITEPRSKTEFRE